MPSHLKRYQAEGSYHLITFSCYRRLPYLNQDAARIVFEEILERLRQRHQFYVFGYVLMPEHVHLLLSEPRRYPLATTLNVLKGGWPTHKTFWVAGGSPTKPFWVPHPYALLRMGGVEG